MPYHIYEQIIGGISYILEMYVLILRMDEVITMCQTGGLINCELIFFKESQVIIMRVEKKSKWVLTKAIRFCYKYMIVYVLILLVATSIGFILNIINKEIINELTNSMNVGTISATFIGMTIAYVFLHFLQSANGFIITFGSNFFKFKVDKLFHRLFMWKSYNESQKSFFDKNFMEKYSFVAGNTEKISSCLASILNAIFINFATVMGSVALFLIYEPWLVLYALIIIISSILTNSFISKREYELRKKQIPEQRYHDYYKEVLIGKNFAKEIRIHKSSGFFYDKWEKVYDILRIDKLKLAIKSARLFNFSTYIRFACRFLAIVLLFIGIYNKKYDIGTFVMLFSLIENCANQIQSLSDVLAKGVFKDGQYLADYYDFLMPITNAEIKEALYRDNLESELYFGKFENLRLENISFKYSDEGKDALDKVSLLLNKGETVSILGYNGSGKTTLSKIITGSLAPTSGRITINNIEVNNHNRKRLFVYFGITPQEFSKFAISIKDYVGLGRIEKMEDEECLSSAYSKVDIESFLEKYSQRDMTILGKQYDKNGTDLSGGEWQRLAIASGYMGDPEILIMDEPSASIDPLREAEFIGSFKEHLKGKTAILISHRIGFARLADRIIMMKDGKICEQGSHEELLKKKGYYAELFYAQKRLYEEEI